MKCTKCHEKEADYVYDCLMIVHQESYSFNQKTIRENASGFEKVGICEECLKKNADCSWNWAEECVYIFVILGIASFFFSYFILSIPLAIRLTFFGAAIVSKILSKAVIGPKIIKEKPYLFFNSIFDGTKRPVPVGDNFYKNKRQFCDRNHNLLLETQKKIYNTLIVNDAWKVLLRQNEELEKMKEAELPDDGSTLNRCVNRLLELYRQKPEGYLVGEASQVRAVGEELNKEGGMELMLQAHALFSQKNTRMGMARNLEMVWDGIGGWMG